MIHQQRRVSQCPLFVKPGFLLGYEGELLRKNGDAGCAGGFCWSAARWGAVTSIKLLAEAEPNLKANGIFLIAAAFF